MSLVPLSVAAARPASGGEWSYLLWLEGDPASWWPGATYAPGHPGATSAPGWPRLRVMPHEPRGDTNHWFVSGGSGIGVVFLGGTA